MCIVTKMFICVCYLFYQDLWYCCTPPAYYCLAWFWLNRYYDAAYWSCWSEVFPPTTPPWFYYAAYWAYYYSWSYCCYLAYYFSCILYLLRVTSFSNLSKSAFIFSLKSSIDCLLWLKKSRFSIKSWRLVAVFFCCFSRSSCAASLFY